MKKIMFLIIISLTSITLEIAAQNQLKVVLHDTTISNATDKGKDWLLKSIRLPGDFSGTNVRFLSSDSLAGTFYYYLYDGDTLTVTVKDSIEVGFKPIEVYGLGRFIKIVSDAEEDSSVVYIERHLFE